MERRSEPEKNEIWCKTWAWIRVSTFEAGQRKALAETTVMKLAQRQEVENSWEYVSTKEKEQLKQGVGNVLASSYP